VKRVQGFCSSTFGKHLAVGTCWDEKWSREKPREAIRSVIRSRNVEKPCDGLPQRLYWAVLVNAKNGTMAKIHESSQNIARVQDP
jgi:hypothetical protein